MAFKYATKQEELAMQTKAANYAQELMAQGYSKQVVVKNVEHRFGLGRCDTRHNEFMVMSKLGCHRVTTEAVEFINMSATEYINQRFNQR
jgi:hypothetical protein